MASRTATREKGRPLVEYLALSGGADDGAFGAGLLVGWSKRGDRPKFEVVTGVSAGALIAPYAFLGPSYDRQLAELWTTFDANAVATPQVLAGLLGAEALADSTPLRNLIAKHVDRRMLEPDCARVSQRPRAHDRHDQPRCPAPGDLEHGRDRGRRRPRGSGSRRAVPRRAAGVGVAAWHLSARACQSAGGRPGVTKRCTSTAARRGRCSWRRHSFRCARSTSSIRSRPIRRVFVVRNGKLTPVYEAVKPNTFAISARSLFTVTKNQSIGDINQIYAMTQRDGAEFRLASIPASFTRAERAAVRPGLHEGAVRGRLQARPAGQPPGRARRPRP